MAHKLPPLNALRLFEAAARHASFKRAAEELHLTSSAISHAVQGLEDWLGAELFHRGTRGLTLTPAGSQLAASASQALALIAQAAERLRGRTATGTLFVSSAPTFAARWLLPRLPRFAAQYPDVRVSIDTSRQVVELGPGGIDLAIRMARKSGSGGTWIQLVEVLLIPVCSPAIRAQFDGPWSEMIAKVPLIHVTNVSDDWAAWFHSTGMTPPDLEGGLRVDTIQMSIDAAAQGLGVALGRKPLIDEYLVQGRLVEVGGPAVAGSVSYWLVGADSTFERREIRLFRSWLLSELDGGRAAPSGPVPTRVGR